MMEVVSGDNWSYKSCRAAVKSSPPTSNFFQTGCLSRRPTSSVRALKEKRWIGAQVLVTLLPVCVLGAANVMFSYEVEFRWSEVRWASRWNVYLEMADLNIHWFSIINSVIVVFFLAGQFHIA